MEHIPDNASHTRQFSAAPTTVLWTAQGSLLDLNEALTYGRCAAMSLRCRGSTKLMLYDLQVGAHCVLARLAVVTLLHAASKACALHWPIPDDRR